MLAVKRGGLITRSYRAPRVRELGLNRKRGSEHRRGRRLVEVALTVTANEIPPAGSSPGSWKSEMVTSGYKIVQVSGGNRRRSRKRTRHVGHSWEGQVLVKRAVSLV